MLIERLLKNTKFKADAADIARQLAKRGIDRLELLADAPGRLQSVRVWGHPLSEVIDAIREAAKEASKDKTTKPLDEMPASEPSKAVGGK